MTVLARLLAAVVLVCIGGAPRAADLRLGATYTLEDSGILATLLGAFTAARGVKVRPLVAGTGQVMKYAENGDVDLVFTHSRPDEERLVARGIGKARADVMWNDFIIAGPSSDPARIRGLRDAPQALQRIRAAGAKFVSRGDDSGTNQKELQL
jgi:tungstate transport system substrate-binding protein